MKMLAERTFSLADQRAFAALSGDFNPMHMDEVAARRTLFGAPVVHGVHLLCWALESWLGNRRAGVALESLTANFNRGALVGETVQAWVVSEGEAFSLRILRGQTELTSIQGRLGGPPVAYPEPLPALELTPCRVMDPAGLAQAMGSLPLSYCAADARMLFPQMSALLPPLQLAVLLATTRLVGMECPGLYSLYSALDLSFTGEPAGTPELKYSVAHARGGAFCLAVDGPGFSGELEGSIRPAPSRQASARELAPLVEQGEFSGQSSVVIGGSRGLGEVVAKLLALGGAEVTITYRRGKEDAEAVAADILSGGGKCGVAQFDTDRPASIALPQPPTHVYYFATPHITSDRNAVFSAERFGEYCRYYATGFVQTLLAVASGIPTLSVLYPSTVFLDERPDHMAEYCSAKAAGEEICRQLEKRFPGWNLYAPRLPRMLTDQNNGLIPTEIQSPELIMLRHLRAMKHPFSGPPRP